MQREKIQIFPSFAEGKFQSWIFTPRLEFSFDKRRKYLFIFLSFLHDLPIVIITVSNKFNSVLLKRELALNQSLSNTYYKSDRLYGCRRLFLFRL